MATPEELQAQGVKLYGQHDYEAAARAFQQAREAYTEVNRMDMVAEMKVNIGLVHRSLGENQQALELMQDALRTFQEQEDLLRAAQVLGNMGGVYSALNDKEQAYASYRQAADIFLEIDEMTLYSETLQALGRLQLRDGKIFMGAATYKVGLDMVDEDQLSGRQKIMKRLTNFINGLNSRMS